MASSNAFGEFLSGARRTGQDLSARQKKQLNKLIQSPKKGGKGKTVTAKELKQGQKAVKASGKDFGDYLGTVARTYGTSQLNKKAQKKLESAGYTQQGGYYTKQNPITGEMLSRGEEAGFKGEDIRGYLSGLSSKDFGEGAARYMQQGEYDLDASTGKWGKRAPIGITDSSDDSAGGPTDFLNNFLTGQNQGIFAGLNPDEMSGYTPAEIDYATRIDPYKIQAKSSERQAKFQLGSNLYGLIPYAFN